MKKQIISLLIIIFSLTSFQTLASEQNWKPAQVGDKIILIRHAKAPGGGDPEGFKIDDCKTQRNLDMMGINQAKKIGKLFREKKEVKASKVIGKLLFKNKIYFAGIDFVQEKLIGDINVTSPTGLAAYKDLSGINLAKLFWNNI